MILLYYHFMTMNVLKKNAYIPSREESLNNERIHKEQKDTQLAKARALKEKFKNMTKINQNIF